VISVDIFVLLFLAVANEHCLVLTASFADSVCFLLHSACSLLHSSYIVFYLSLTVCGSCMTACVCVSFSDVLKRLKTLILSGAGLYATNYQLRFDSSVHCELALLGMPSLTCPCLRRVDPRFGVVPMIAGHVHPPFATLAGRADLLTLALDVCK
jgi:hypothetical protein